jgi:hypothetical protein
MKLPTIVKEGLDQETGLAVNRLRGRFLKSVVLGRAPFFPNEFVGHPQFDHACAFLTFVVRDNDSMVRF